MLAFRSSRLFPRGAVRFEGRTPTRPSRPRPARFHRAALHASHPAAALALFHRAALHASHPAALHPRPAAETHAACHDVPLTRAVRPRSSRSLMTSLSCVPVGRVHRVLLRRRSHAPVGGDPCGPPRRHRRALLAAAVVAPCHPAVGGGDVATPSPPLATPFSPPCGANPL
jgi:hypothetical protein